MGSRNFFTFYVLPDRTPTGGKSQNTGILGHLSLGRPLALTEISGLGRNQKNAIYRCYRHFLGELRTPQKLFLESAQLFAFYVLADQTPTGGKSGNTGLLGHFGLGRLLALSEIPGGKQKNRNTLIETETREANPLQLGPNTQSGLGLGSGSPSWYRLVRL